MKKNGLEYYNLHANTWWQEGETFTLSNIEINQDTSIWYIGKDVKS